jgi:hypothetical protein
MSQTTVGGGARAFCVRLPTVRRPSQAIWPAGAPSRQLHRASARSKAGAERSPSCGPNSVSARPPLRCPSGSLATFHDPAQPDGLSRKAGAQGESPDGAWGWVCEPSVRIRPAANNSTQPIWFPRAMTGPPELDVAAAIRAYCEQRVPQHAREDVRVEAELDGNAVTIVERRSPWRPGLGPEWTSSPIARLRFVVRDESWTPQWCDRNSRWHRYTDGTQQPTSLCSSRTSMRTRQGSSGADGVQRRPRRKSAGRFW